MRPLLKRVLNRCGLVTKYDLNEYARRFLNGEDLPNSVDGYVSPESAMRISAVYACVKIRSDNVASLPLTVYERLPDGGQQESPDHPVARLLAAPSRYQTTLEWVQQQVACIDLRGNGISLKVREGGRVTQLIPVHPSRVTLEQYGDAVLYRVTLKDGRQILLTSDDVLHLPGFSTDGYWGLTPVSVASDSITLARKVQKYGINIFESGAAKRVLLKFPNELDDDAIKNLRRSWEEIGKDSAKTAILEQGGDATTIGMNADEAQYLETRQMSIADIARIYTVPLMLLGVHDKTSSYASTEQFDLLFGKYTIRPICKRIESRIDRYLINDPRYFCKFNMDALLRGDIKTRTEALAAQFERGAINLDEWRGLENRNPIGDKRGTTHFVPVNLQPAERALEPKQDPQPPEEPDGGLGGDDNRERHYLEPVARDIARRIVGKELRELPGANDLNEFRKRHSQYVYRCLRPLFEAAGVDDDELREKLAGDFAAQLQSGIETDPDNREQELTCRLMSAVDRDVLESVRWRVKAAAARLAIEQAAACDDNHRPT